MKRAIGLCALLWGVSPAYAADFATGVAAYDGGRYGEALANWRPLADAGHIRAQVAIAGMYRNGTGTTPNARQAARWYRRAAEAGDPIAQLNYAEMLRDGIGTGRDRAAARRWFDRAARQGNAWAAQQRDALDGPKE